MCEDQIIQAVDVFYNEVSNGGFLQFIVNSSGAYLSEIVECLRAIGADEAADICQTALSSFPQALPEDSETRRILLADNLTQEIASQLQECDMRFNMISANLEETIDRYIDKHTGENTEHPSAQKAKAKDYHELFIKHLSRTCSTYDEATDPKLRRKNNIAMRAVHELNMELLAMPDKGWSIIQKLLHNADPRVRISAGAYCIMAQLYADIGRTVLNQLAEDSTLPRKLRFDARNCLKYCKPYNA